MLRPQPMAEGRRESEAGGEGSALKFVDRKMARLELCAHCLVKLCVSESRTICSKFVSPEGKR